jgi:hypothetical protein
MKITYQCETCEAHQPLRTWVFPCRECEKEICEDCMRGWGRCKPCSEGRSDAELQTLFDAESE